MITIRDVAQKAKVSLATASRALSNQGYVSKDVKRKVLKAAKELGYVKDSRAAHLRSGQSNLIGVIVSDANNFFYNIALSELDSYLKEKNQTLILSYSNEDAERERECLKALMASKVHTIIFTPTSDQNADLVKIAIQNGIKVVQLYRKVYPDISSIIFDDELGAYLACKALIEQGCKRPMLIDVSYKNFDSEKVSPNRSIGFKKAIEEEAIADSCLCSLDLIDADDKTLEEQVASFQPDGIVSGNNTFCLKLIHVLEQNEGYKAIKFITFDDLPWVSMLNISAIRQPIKTLIGELVSSLSDKDCAFFCKKIAPSLAIRKLCLE